MKSFGYLITAMAFVAALPYAIAAPAPKAPAAVQNIKGATAAANAMGKDIKVLVSSASGKKAYALARGIVKRINTQTTSFNSAIKTLPKTPSAKTCKAVTTAFHNYVTAYNDLALNFATAATNSAFTTSGYGSGGASSNIASDVVAALKRLQTAAGPGIDNEVGASGFVITLSNACYPGTSTGQTGVDQDSATLGTSYTMDIAAYTADIAT